MKKMFVFAMLCCVLGLSACSANGGGEVKTPETSGTADVVEPTPEPVSMTVEEKVGQLFVVRPEALHIVDAEAKNTGETIVFDHLTAEMQASIEKYHIGGVTLFSGNITTPENLLTFTADLQNSSKTPMLISVDEEGGLVARLANAQAFDLPKYESMEAIGNTNDPQAAYEVGSTIGSYLKKYGFNLDFAPVADTNTNPENVVIASRAFGSDPNLVAEMVQAEIEGMHSAGVLATLKHFPGHGDTKEDSHNGYVRVDKTWEELVECELVPFVANLETTDLVMVAHITTPNVTADGLPASLSKEMITDKLRGELGYDGVVVTDALEMGAITSEYSAGDAAVKAVLAGVDILLMPSNFVEAYNAVLAAVEDGTISMERLDESVERILKLKESFM